MSVVKLCVFGGSLEGEQCRVGGGVIVKWVCPCGAGPGSDWCISSAGSKDADLRPCSTVNICLSLLTQHTDLMPH